MLLHSTVVYFESTYTRCPTNKCIVYQSLSDIYKKPKCLDILRNN